jgi:hypothetical protein
MLSRGTARNLVISTSLIDRNILSVKANITIYKKNKYSSLYSYINLKSSYIVTITMTKNFKINIEGYDRLSWEDSMIFLNPSKFESKYIVIEGVKLTWEELMRDQVMKSKIVKIDNYFGILSKDKLDRIKKN